MRYFECNEFHNLGTLTLNDHPPTVDNWTTGGWTIYQVELI